MKIPRMLLIPLVLLLVFAAPAFAQEATEVSGRAFGISATGFLAIAEPNPEVILPPEGGDVSDSAASARIRGESSPEEGEPVSALVAVSATGNLEQGTSTATATVNYLTLQELVSASLLRATSSSSCGPDGAQSSGNAVIDGLRIINPETVEMELVEATGEPNQTIQLLFEEGITNTFILNRQTGDDTNLRVDALYYRLTLDQGNGGEESVAGEIVVASAKSDITCAADADQQQGDIGGNEPASDDKQTAPSGQADQIPSHMPKSGVGGAAFRVDLVTALVVSSLCATGCRWFMGRRRSEHKT